MQLQLIIAALGVIVLGLAVAGQVARRRLARRYGPTGRIVRVRGRRTHLVDRGSGPVVVLESGTWGPAASWEPVIERLAPHLRVVAVDRAGLGFSDPSGAPRTPIVIADELAASLDAAGIGGPVVIVGHSFGGVVARVFAFRFPRRVSGLVLVDAAHEAQFEQFPAGVRAMQARMGRVMPTVLGAARLLVASGLVALRPSLVPAALGPLRAETLAAIRARVAATPSVVATMAAEMRDLDRGFSDVRALGIAAPGTLADTPLRVISHGRAEALPPQLGAEVAAEYEATWQALQASLEHLSRDSRRIVAEGVGHAIPVEAPELVVEAVLEVLDRASALGRTA